MTEHLTALFEGIPLWEMSLTAVYVTAVVVLLRLLLKRRAPRRFLCLLWLVVFVRLLVPVKLESPLSLVPPALSDRASVWETGGGPVSGPFDPAGGLPDTTNGSSQAPVGADGLAFGSASDGWSSPETSTPGAPSGQPPQTVNRRAESSRPTPTSGNASVVAFPWKALLAGVWLAGAAAMLGCGLVTYVRLRRRVRLAVRVSDRVWEDDSVSSPFILGLFRPRIYLPSGLEGRARRFILCHEFAHLRRFDHVVKPLCWLALALHWFNPAVWLAFLLLSRDMEGACDEAVLRSLGEDVKADYSYTLLALASGKQIPAPCPLAFDEGDAKGRIKNVLNYRRPALWIVVVSVIAVAVAAVCLLTDPVAAEEPADPPAPSESEPGPSQSAGPSEPSASQTGVSHMQFPADPWMVEVLKGELNFSVYYSYDGHETQWNISQLADVLYNGYSPVESIAVEQVAILDLDGDGARELVIDPGDSYKYATGYLILRQEGDAIQGYNPSWRSFGTLKADGTYSWSGSAFYSGTGRVCFEGGEFVGEHVIWCDFTEGKQDYFVDGQPATEEEFNAAIAAQDAKREPVWFPFETGALQSEDESWKDLMGVNYFPGIPVDPAVNVSVPWFLDMDQQRRYQWTYSLYSHLFGADTSAIDEWGWSGPEALPPAEPVEVDGYTYVPSTGMYARWEHLEAAALSVFTPEFWQARNTWLDNDGNPHQTFLNVDGRTYYLDGARGSTGRDPYFPDTFHLLQQTESELSFVLVGRYSETLPLEGESEEAREARLKDNWEEYIGFPMKLVLTENGWRFDEFHVTDTDNALEPYASQAAPNPELYPESPEPEAGACVHGLDHVYVDHLIDGRLVYRCQEDFFPYYPPYPCAYSSESIAEGDYDGDGHIEEIVVGSAGTLMLCDVVDGELRTCTFDPRTLADAYPDADIPSAWIEPGDELIYCVPLREEPNGASTGTVELRLRYDGERLTEELCGLPPAPSPAA